MLLRNSPLPLNYQLSQLIEGEIAAGKWPLGQKLPGVREMTALFGVSLPVVRQALQLLEQRGVIRTLHGKGSYVRSIPAAPQTAEVQTLIYHINESQPLRVDFLLKLLNEMEKEAAAKGLQMEFMRGAWDPARMFRPGMRPAFVLCGDVASDLVGEILSRGCPLVRIGGAPEGQTVPCLVNDDFGGGRLAGEHLCAAGCRELGAVMRSRELQHVRDRVSGFLTAAQAAGRDVAPGRILYDEGEGFGRNLRSCLADLPEGCGIFAGSDRLAHAVLQAAGELGRRVPADFLLVGFDDDQFARFLSPPLTTIRINLAQMAREAIGILTDQYEGGGYHGRLVRIGVELVVRESTAQPAAARR